MMIRIISLILAALMLLSVVACSDGSGSPTGDSTSAGPVRTIDDDGLPELDFGGKTVTLITSSLGYNDNGSDMYRKTITNDVLNDAIYNRKEKVEERLKVDLNIYIETVENSHAVVIDSVLTGLDEYQILGGWSAHTYSSVHLGYFYNLLHKDNAKYLDISREWWNQYMIENSTVYDNCSVITGALSLTYVKDAYATFFDKAYAAEHGIDSADLFSLVRQGKWTKDKELELIKGMYSDVTGDGKTEDDCYGIIMSNDALLDTFWSAYDVSLLKRTDDGGIEFNTNQEKVADMIESVYGMVFENSDIYTYDWTSYADDGAGIDDYITEAFAADQCLFSILKLKECDRQSLRNMKEGYGIIPLAKWDELQPDYYTYIGDRFEVYTIPKTARDTDATSATLEALAIESYKYVAPAYYNKVLNGRYMTDPDSSEMLDIVTTNVRLPTDWVFAFALKKMPQEALRYLISEQHSSSFSSFWRANKRKYMNELEYVLGNYRKIDN